MNTYEELITELRDDYKAYGDGRRQYFFDVTLRCKEAADAIEQLVKERDELGTKCHGLEKERDAAVADLTVDKNCDFCTWQVNGECIDYEYERCTGEHWEWRGVQEVGHETD